MGHGVQVLGPLDLAAETRVGLPGPPEPTSANSLIYLPPCAMPMLHFRCVPSLEKGWEGLSWNVCTVGFG